MNKKLLLEKYVRVAIKKAIQEQEERQKKAEKAMYLIYRFPGLRKSQDLEKTRSIYHHHSNL